MVCPHIEICSINISKEHYDKYCIGETSKCWRYKDLETVRKTPLQWHEGGDK